LMEQYIMSQFFSSAKINDELLSYTNLSKSKSVA
jgi:hypothetical protein